MNDKKHTPTYVIEPGPLDIFRCSCGWQSKPYYDGAEFAYTSWKTHAEEANKREANGQATEGTESQTTNDAG